MKYILLLAILLMTLTGCGAKGSTEEATNAMLDYAQDKMSDADEATWLQNCQTVTTSLTGIEGISSITLIPNDFASYKATGKVTVQITLDDPANFSAREQVNSVIQNYGLQNSFEIMYMN